MPTRACPTCAAVPLRHLDDVSSGAHVEYFRCDDCARCYTVPKATPSSALTEITHISAAAAVASPRSAGGRAAS